MRSPSIVNAKGEKIDLTFFCQPVVFGPWVHPLKCLLSINTSLQAHRDTVLGVASKPLAALRSSCWIDVRDLTLAQVEAVYIRLGTSGKQFVVCGPEKSDFQREVEIIKEAFPGLSERLVVSPIGPAARTRISLDGGVRFVGSLRIRIRQRYQ